MHAHHLDNVTPLPSPAPPSGTVATVERLGDDDRMHLSNGFQARRAASCLLPPAVGDRVWVVAEREDEGWVLAVLERAEGTATTLAVPGDLSVRAEGRLTLGGGQGVDVATPETLRLQGEAVQVQAGTAHVALRELTVLARTVFASLAKVTRVGRVLELLVERVTQRSQHSVRAIEGVDATRAGAIDLRADGRANIQASHALVNGKDLVKMDGGQIHLG